MEDLKKENTAFKEYITKTGLSVLAFSMKVEIQASLIAGLMKNDSKNVTTNLAKRLYKASKRVFGEGFKLTESMDLYKD